MLNNSLSTTEVFYFFGRKKPGIKIGIGFRDTGGFNALRPVIEELAKSGEYDLIIWADSQAKEKLKQLGLKLEKTQEDILNSIDKAEIKLGLISISDNPAIETTLMLNFKKRGIPVVQLTDLPGNGFKHLEHIPPSYRIYPDILCEVDEWGKKEEFKVNPDFPEDKIIITGMPALDRFFKEDIEKLKKDLKKKLEIQESEMIITFISGTANQLPEKALADLLEVIDLLELKNYRFAFRKHPGDTNSDLTYSQILNKLGNKFLNLKTLNTDEVVSVSDIVISLGSTVGMEALCRGIISINYMKEEYIGPNERIREVTFLPIMFDGSSPTAYNKSQLFQLLKKTLINKEFRNNILEKMKKWKITEKSAPKVIEIIKNAI